MGFYGNLSNTSRLQYQYDKVYTSRVAMDAALNKSNENETSDDEKLLYGDGVFIGRFVLISYLKDAKNIPIVEEINGETDDSKYKRTYDGTVWRKISKDGEFQYELIAELNCAAPSISVNMVPPTDEPGKITLNKDKSSVSSYVCDVPKIWGTADPIINIHEKGFDKTVNGIGYKNKDGDPNQDEDELENEIYLSSIGEDKEHPDKKQLTINLPALGNAVGEVYDLIYGEERNQSLDNDFPKTLTQNDLNSLIGSINWVKDIIGLNRFVALSTGETSLEDGKIYYEEVEEDGVVKVKYYRKDGSSGKQDITAYLTDVYGCLLELLNTIKGNSNDTGMTTVTGLIYNLNNAINTAKATFPPITAEDFNREEYDADVVTVRWDEEGTTKIVPLHRKYALIEEKDLLTPAIQNIELSSRASNISDTISLNQNEITGTKLNLDNGEYFSTYELNINDTGHIASYQKNLLKLPEIDSSNLYIRGYDYKEIIENNTTLNSALRRIERKISSIGEVRYSAPQVVYNGSPLSAHDENDKTRNCWVRGTGKESSTNKYMAQKLPTDYWFMPLTFDDGWRAISYIDLPPNTTWIINVKIRFYSFNYNYNSNVANCNITTTAGHNSIHYTFRSTDATGVDQQEYTTVIKVGNAKESIRYYLNMRNFQSKPAETVKKYAGILAHFSNGNLDNISDCSGVTGMKAVRIA